MTRQRRRRPDISHIGLSPIGAARTMGQMTGIDCIAVLKALGELNRMRILRLLLKSQLSVSEIVQRLKISQYTVSKHLKVLRDAGLVQVEKKGKLRLYAVASDLQSHLKSTASVLELGCCTFRFDQLPK